jgi:hypothetical protein
MGKLVLILSENKWWPCRGWPSSSGKWLNRKRAALRAIVLLKPEPLFSSVDRAALAALTARQSQQSGQSQTCRFADVGNVVVSVHFESRWRFAGGSWPLIDRQVVRNDWTRSAVGIKKHSAWCNWMQGTNSADLKLEKRQTRKCRWLYLDNIFE